MGNRVDRNDIQERCLVLYVEIKQITSNINLPLPNLYRLSVIPDQHLSVSGSFVVFVFADIRHPE